MMVARICLRPSRPPSIPALAAGFALLILILIFFSARRESFPDITIPSLGADKKHATPPPPQTTHHNHGPSIADNVFNTTLGFEKIFVVGLPSRTDRRDSMTLAAALSNIEVEFIDGVMADDVPDKAVPAPPADAEKQQVTGAVRGSWRGHMNAVQEIVRRNLTSALILEDDSDWDIRISEQLHNLAMASQALTQPLMTPRAGRAYADPTYPKPGKNPKFNEIPYSDLPSTKPATWFPYGDDVELVWLGHCHMNFPPEIEGPIPKGRVVRSDDVTVPEQQHLLNKLGGFPNHTRVYHHVGRTACSLAYGVTRKGALSLLLELGMKPVTDAFDVLLSFFCEGDGGKNYHRCMTTQPGVFQHHRPVGRGDAESDISGHGGYRDVAKTDIVRWSVRVNAEALMSGETVEDQFPDT